MKLHLPKLLFVAVVAAASFTQADTINVGKADTVNSFLDNLFQRQENLTVKDGEKVGYMEGSNLVTDFDLKLDNNGTVANSLLLGTYERHYSLGFIPNGYDIYGTHDLCIEGSGQVYLGGKNGSNQFATLVAKNVEIAAEATGTADKEKSNLVADALTVETLTINGGSAFIRTEEGGGCTTSGNAYDSMKSATITKGLYINDGYLKMGRQANTSSSDQNKATNEHFVNIIKGAFEQKNGEAELLGKTYLEIEQLKQTGGTMTLAKDTVANRYEYLRLGKDMTIHQEGANSKLTIEGMIIAGSKGTSQRKLTIEQIGSGTISLQNGIMYKGSANNASSVTQSGGGTIKLNGDYTSTVFNLTQKELGGTINLNGNMNANVVEQSAGRLEVASSGKLTANTVNAGVITSDKVSVQLNKNVTLSNGELKTDGSTVTNTGKLTANTVNVNSGSLKMDGNGSLSATTINAGVVTNDKASVQLNANETLTNVTLTNGTLKTDGSTVTNTGKLTADTVNVNSGKLEMKDSGSLDAGKVNAAGVAMNGNVALYDGAISTENNTVTNSGKLAADSISVATGNTLKNDENAVIVVGKNLELAEGAKLVNNGIISGSSAFALMTTEDQAEAVLGGTIILNEGSEVLNAGKIENDILVNGGTLTLNQDGSTQNITMTAGEILVTGSNVQTGSLTLDGGTINFEAGAMVNLKEGETLTITKGTTIMVTVSTEMLENLAGQNFELFGGNVENITNATFVFTDGDNDTSNDVTDVTISLGGTSGSIKVENIQSVPEPTTATLSLLALVGLAARRRRK